jgi:cell division protein ZapE
MTTAAGPVSGRLAGEIAAHGLADDPAQRRVALRMDGLIAALTAPAAGSLLSRWWRGRGEGDGAPRGLYLWGGVGRGKTHLLDLFYASLAFPERERSHFYRFMQDVHAALRKVDGRSDPLRSVAQQLAARARVLCLDEFFVADIADAMILGGLLEALFERGVTVVTTSNQAPRDLYKDGLQRARFLPAIASIERHLDVVELDGGTDYRLLRLKTAHVYWDAADPRAPAEMRRLFDSLTGAAASGPVQIAVAGRDIPARDTSAGTAWFEFDALCRGPRGAGDYIELARRFHTVFVSDVPVFGDGDEDPARRFLTLVDEFYDRRVKLIVSAAAAPQQLYRGERLRLEFPRAVSRLVEMQSERYLAEEHLP